MARKALYPPSVDPALPVLPDPPPGWVLTTFGDVLEPVSRRVSLEAQREYTLVIAKRNRGGIELRGKSVGDEILTKTQFETHSGDFLISRRQIIHGACGVVPDALHGSIVSGEYSALRPRDGITLDFLRHYSHTPYFQRTCFHSSHGVDVEKMVFKLERWLQWPVVLPPLPEQRKIAAILSSVDEAIEKTQAVIDQVQVVKKGLMQELLTKGLPGRHQKFKQTEIGTIPESWEVVDGEDMFSLAGGYGPSSISFEPEGDAIFVKVGDLDSALNGRIIVDSQARFFRQANPSIKCYGVGSLVFPKRGAAIFKSRVSLLSRPTAVDPNLMVMTPNVGVNVSFVRHFLLHMELHNISDNSGIPQINNKHLYPLRFPLPPSPEQDEIAAIIDLVESRVELENEALDQLRTLKSALMQSLLTGQLRVTP